MKLELMKKHGKNVITLYSIHYIIYLTSSLWMDGTPQPIVSTINSSMVVQPISTPVNPPPQAHLIQIGNWSDIPGPSRPKKKKTTLPVLEEEALVEDKVEVPPYKFNNIPTAMLQRDTYRRTYVNVAPEETLRQFKQVVVVEGIGARLQASAIRKREARSMILEGLKWEAQHKKEVVDLKLSLSNMTRLNKTLSHEQGTATRTLQKQHDDLKQSFQALSEEYGKLTCLNAELNGGLAEEDQNRIMVVDSVNTRMAKDRI